jgi:hypothetical protein
MVVVCLLLGDSPMFVVSMLTFQNNMSVPSSKVKMGQCSKTLALKLWATVNHSEESIQHSEHGGSFKSRKLCFCKIKSLCFLIVFGSAKDYGVYGR